MTGEFALGLVLQMALTAWGGPFVPPAGTTTVLLPGADGAGAVSIISTEPTVFVHRSTGARKIPSNGLVVVTANGGLLLVDTAWTEAETEAILSWGEDRLRRPWIGAVITHDHDDRDGGIAALQRRHIPIAALDLTVAKLEKRGVHGVTTLLAAADGARKDQRGFEAFFPGPGHAPDNIVLRFPSVVFGGCLVKSLEARDSGFTGDADLKGWPDAIRKVQARYGAQRLVPGHGPVDPTGKALQHTLELLAAPK